MRNLIFTTAIFLFLPCISAHASDSVLKINDDNDFYNPALKATYLIDVKNKLKINDILSPEYQDKFIANSNEIPEFGLMPSSVWFKFRIKNLLQFSPYFEIVNPALDTIEYFLFNNNGELVHHQLAGGFEKVGDRTIRTGQIIMDMQLHDSNDHTCYLKINSKSASTIVPMRIASLKKFYETKHTDLIWQGLYFGLILFLFIYNLFLFFSLRELTYLYFALFIAFLGLLFALLKGFGLHYLWSSFPYFQRHTAILGSLAGIFGVLFTSSFLNSAKKTPKLHNWLLALVGFYVIIIGLNLSGIRYVSMKLLEYNSLLVLFFLMFVAVKTWRGGFEPSKYYLLAWSIYVVGFIVFIFRENGWIETNYFTGYILQMSTTVTVLFMSFALSKKINIYIEKRNEAQELVLKTALENEKLVSDQNQLLEAKVNQRTIDLEQTIATLSKQRKDLHEVNDFKDKVFSIISHDLKSPISNLAGLLKLMKTKSLNESEKTKVVQSLEIALKNTKNLLDNILAWANKNDNSPKETDEIELHKTVEETLELFQYQSGLKGIRLINQVEKGFHIIAHKNMLQLVLRNLISNAIKFTPKNGSVFISMKQDFLNLLLIVKDTGIGMSKEIKSNLFKANKHTSTRGTENEKGTGLGLLLCKEFVDKYNGELLVESEPGKGSSFTVKLNDAIPVLETVSY